MKDNIISKEWQSGFAAAERSDGPRNEWTQAVNIVNTLGIKRSLTGSEMLGYLERAIAQGIDVPSTRLNKLSPAERRAFTNKVQRARQDLLVAADSQSETGKVWTPSLVAELKRQHESVARQQQEIDDSMKPDPLQKIADKRK